MKAESFNVYNEINLYNYLVKFCGAKIKDSIIISVARDISSGAYDQYILIVASKSRIAAECLE